MPVFYPRAKVVIEVLLEPFGTGDETTIHTITATPREVEIRQNDHRQADTAEVTVDYDDLPLDPRAVRWARVSAFLADMGRNADLEIQQGSREHLRFLGFADDSAVRLGDDGETVTLSCRDYTALLLDYPWDGRLVDVTRPLSRVVSDVLEGVPGTAGGRLPVEYTEGAADVVLKDLVGKKKWAPRGQQDNAWTILVELCGLAGLIPVVKLDTLWVLTANEQGEQRAEFVYGGNVERLELKRKRAEVETAQIEARCWDAATRTTRVGLWPESAAGRKKIGADGKATTDVRVLPFLLAGTYSETDLRNIARGIYDEMRLGQVEGRLETRNLRDVEEDGATDLTRLRNADTLSLAVARDDLFGLQSLSRSEAVRYLVDVRRYQRAVAEAVVDAYTRAGDWHSFSVWYIREATHRWSRDDGYRLEVNFIGATS